MSGHRVCAVLAPALAALTPAPAAGHGPCGCLDPVLVQVGGTVRITGGPGRTRGPGWPVEKVVLNPRPADLGIAPPHLASAYRPDAPTVTVMSRPRGAPTRRASFRVPATPDGLYMVLIFDGGEGGAHNTWDYLHVIDPARSRPPSAMTPAGRRAPPADDRDSVLAAVLGGLAGAMLVLALVGVHLVARRRD